MHRCACSTRALELFIRDFTGLNVRQQRIQIYSQRRRTFATSSAWRRPDLVDVKVRGDDFVPFAGEARQVEEVREEKKLGVDGEGEGKVEGGGREVVEEWKADGDWHAEIEVTAPVSEQMAAEEVHAEAQNGESGQTSSSPGHAIDSASDGATERAERDIAAPEEATGVPKRQAQRRGTGRLERKQQRIAEGKFRPLAAARERGEVVEDRQSTVLGMIEKMEGPRVEKAKPKTPISASERSDKLQKRLAKEKAKMTPSAQTPPAPAFKKEPWQIQKSALTQKFGNLAWSPRKRLSPDTLDGIRALHASDPSTYSTATLSSQFAISPENIRRILRSKWRPSDEEKEERARRWERRGVRKWSEMAEGGEKPPRRWREMGAGSLQGAPGEKPSWKRGGRRSGGREDAGWLDQDGEGDGEGLGGRIL